MNTELLKLLILKAIQDLKISFHVQKFSLFKRPPPLLSASAPSLRLLWRRHCLGPEPCVLDFTSELGCTSVKRNVLSWQARLKAGLAHTLESLSFFFHSQTTEMKRFRFGLTALIRTFSLAKLCFKEHQRLHVAAKSAPFLRK